MLLGVITLYKTFALYEEEKTFNVLKGKIPDFKMINTIVNVNGEIVNTIPSKEEGYLIEDVVCDKGATGVWNNETWQVEIENQREVEITCTVSFIDEFRKLVKIIGSEATNMDELLKNTSDVNKIIASQEAMELIVNSKRLPNDIRQNENYTVNVRKQFLSSKAVSEQKKYNAGLPFHVFPSQWNFTPIIAGDTTATGYTKGVEVVYLLASYAKTHITIISENKFNISNYDYLEVDYTQGLNHTSLTGTVFLGLGSDRTNTFSVYNYATHGNLNKKRVYLTTKISDYKGEYYLKLRIRHDGQVSAYTVHLIEGIIALY